MYNELGNYYQSYLRAVVAYKVNADLLTMRINDVSEIVRNVEMDDILFTYECFDKMISILWRIFEHQEFCSKTRLYQKVTYLMMKDMFQIYKVFYIMIVEILERFGELENSDAKKAFVVYQNFVSLTKAMKKKCPVIMGKFIINLKQPKYYEIDETLIENLRVCVENNSGGGQASAALQKGIDRNAFQTSAIEEQKEEQYEDYGSDSGDEMPSP